MHSCFVKFVIGGIITHGDIGKVKQGPYYIFQNATLRVVVEFGKEIIRTKGSMFATTM